MKGTNKKITFNNETVDIKELTEMIETVDNTRVNENDLYQEFEKTFLESNKDKEDE